MVPALRAKEKESPAAMPEPFILLLHPPAKEQARFYAWEMQRQDSAALSAEHKAGPGQQE